jgi:ubiquinone biosynthesis protein UbiJ
LQNLQEKLKEISESVAEALATKESVVSIKEELSKMNERILAVEGDLAIDADGDGVADIK